MSSWLVLRDQRPNDYKQQLEPALKSFNKANSIATYKTMFQFYVTEYITEEIHPWADNFYRQQCNDHKILRCWKQLLLHFSSLDLEQSRLPLLSLPTHAPSYIAPEILVQRLLDYEVTQTNLNFTDLALALARMPRQNTEHAIQLTKQLKTDWVRDVVLFALGAEDFPKIIPPQYKELQDRDQLLDWRGLWATVIQTHYTTVEFTRVEEYDHVKQIEASVLPYHHTPRKEYQWDSKKSQYINTVVGQYVRFPLPFYQYSSLPDLYHHQAYNLHQNNQSWDYTTELANGVLFRHFTPLNTSRTDLHAASNHCDSAERFSQSSHHVLTRMMDEDYILNPYALFILATHLFAANKETKLFTVESVSHSIYQSKIDLEIFAQHLATLINHQFAPFSRLNESLYAIKEISPLHEDMLWQLLEHLIPQLDFTDKLPTQFKKFIELYYLLQNHQNSAVADTIQQKLRTWETLSTSLKPLINKILKGN